MRTVIVVAVVSVLCTSNPLVQAAEELFSKVPVRSVFATSSDQAHPGDASRGNGSGEQQVPRVSSQEQLATLLQAAGFDTTNVKDRAVMVNLQRGSWTLPTLFVLGEQNQIWLIMLLSSASSQELIPQEKLLELLTANQDIAPGFFTFSKQRLRAELYWPLPQSAWEANQVRATLERMIEVALQHEKSWDFSTLAATDNKQGKETPAEPDSAERADVAQAAPVITGKWAAAKSNEEAFALQLNEDRSFVLIHVKGTTTNRANGTFAIENNQLTLSSADGTKIVGTLSVKSQNEFDFQPTKAPTPLGFKRA